MGSLSWSPQPSGPHHTTSTSWSPQPSGPHHTTPPQHQDGAWHCLPPDHLDRLGTFLLPDGCPVNDPMVQRFYKLCLESHQNAPLCTKERLSRTQVLTIPYVTNVCSAICHGMDETKTTTCPHRARTIIPYTASNRGVPLLQSSKPDTTFQFGQVLDRTFG